MKDEYFTQMAARLGFDPEKKMNVAHVTVVKSGEGKQRKLYARCSCQVTAEIDSIPEFMKFIVRHEACGEVS